MSFNNLNSAMILITIVLFIAWFIIIIGALCIIPQGHYDYNTVRMIRLNKHMNAQKRGI